MRERFYYVTLHANGDLKNGILKSESLESALEYCNQEYPNYRVTYIKETTDEIL